MNLRELHNDPEKMAEFLGVSYEEWVRDEHYARPSKSFNPRYDLFVCECAREVFGIKGRTAEEVQQKCIEQYPHMFAPVDGEFAPAVVSTATALAPRKLRR